MLIFSMTPNQKKHFYLALALVALLLLAGFMGFSYFIKTAKPHFENAVSNTLGMKSTIGNLHFSLWPPSISAGTIEIEQDGFTVARFATITADLNLLSLIKGQVQFSELKLVKPEITIKHPGNGTWNVNIPKSEKNKNIGINLLPSVFSIQDGSLNLYKGENIMEIQGINVTARDLVLVKDSSRRWFLGLSIKGNLNCKEFRWNKIIIRDFTSQLKGSKGRYIFDPIIFKVFGGSAKGKIETEMVDKDPIIISHLKLSRLNIEEYFAAILNEKLVSGEMELVLDIKAKVEEKQGLLNSITGNAIMKGQNLNIAQFDLDKLLDHYMKTQSFNLVDIGAFAFMGPFGPALTKAHDYSGLIDRAGGSTELRQLMSHWDINKGKFMAQDVALATKKNRVVLSGGIDFVGRLFQNLKVAVVDANGCALISQEMNGPFDNPEVKKPNFIKTVTGPIDTFIKETMDIVEKKDCEVIYNGSVTAPSG